MCISSLSWLSFQYSPAVQLHSSTQSNNTYSCENEVSCLSRSHPKTPLFQETYNHKCRNVLPSHVHQRVGCLNSCYTRFHTVFLSLCLSLLATLQHSPAAAPACHSSRLVCTSLTDCISGLMFI
ncbi:hypothetical protein ATANTOWER_018223 [Ataeniobius toweri]|uniref:Uncharacterized protein n=1 Tax=Ataeniobius toweri TaxID=208326 RepID=A0ABU7BW42_9TELE|nr:hypothetical protein [Ataeniobius toweri]